MQWISTTDLDELPWPTWSKAWHAQHQKVMLPTQGAIEHDLSEELMSLGRSRGVAVGHKR
jgi:hypothetical protein